MLGVAKEMTELLTEQASGLMLAGLAKLRCETKVAEYVTNWLQGKASGKGRDCEPHMPREGPCPMETDLKECEGKIRKRNTPKTEKLVKWEEVRRGHLLKQVEVLEV